MIERTWDRHLQEFARSDQVRTVIRGLFSSVITARQYAHNWSRSGHFSCTASGTGRGSYVDVLKTLKHNQSVQQQYEAAMEEAERLQMWLAQLESFDMAQLQEAQAQAEAIQAVQAVSSTISFVAHSSVELADADVSAVAAAAAAAAVLVAAQAPAQQSASAACNTAVIEIDD